MERTFCKPAPGVCALSVGDEWGAFERRPSSGEPSHSGPSDEHTAVPVSSPTFREVVM